MLEGSFEKELLKGEILFREGEIGDDIYLIKSGKIRIYKKIEEEEKTLAILGPGEIFGEMAVLDGKPRSACAKAEENTILEVLSKESILKIIKSQPILEHLINTLIKRLRIADEQLKLLTIKHEEQRLLSYLIIRFKEAKTKEISMEEIGYFTEIEKETLFSFLEDLERRGIIKIDKEKIILIKPEELEEYRKYIFLKEKFGRIKEEEK